MNKSKEYISNYHSPLGSLQIKSDGENITGIDFLDTNNQAPVVEDENEPSVISECKTQLTEYFNRERKEFTVKIKPEGSAFEKRVWTKVSAVPFGQVDSYSSIAKLVGNVNSSRVVVNANRRNRIPVIIPCHRIISMDGKLTGYAGGLWRKKWLLEFEKTQRQQWIFNPTDI
ncbi:MAG: cysteine methyltransferase [Marinilabiliales bacterium]|nr:MAG: cysteine methyltransferase [Marinilabiliales bacterium]